MTITLPLVTYIIVGLIACALIVAGYHIYRLQVQLHRLEKRCFKLHAEFNAALNTNIGLGKRIFQLERQLAKLQATQQDIISTQTPINLQKRSYKTATKLVEKGASVEELVTSCDISQGEAELLAHLNMRAATH
jgi:hypothetical protein